MGLVITFRPQKDLYVTNPPTAYDEPYYNSRWVAGHLPIQYKISNTKWPLNSDDDTDNICAVADVNGLAQIDLCGTYETYVKYEYIKIEGCTESSYNGVWQILDVVNATTLTIGAAYVSTATGTLQRYYNNYYNLVKVFAGIPSYHQYESEDPMSLVATLKIAPNSSNLSIADISGLVQAKLNCDNDLDQISTPNDLNAWTGFYIEYAESYDKSDGTEVTTFTSSYTTDNNTDCTATQIIQNGDFTSNLNGWGNGGPGSSWTWVSGKASTTRGANNFSKVLYQEASFLKGVQYNIRVSFSNNQAASIRVRIKVYTNTSLSTGIIIGGNTNGLSVFSLQYNFTPAVDYAVIGFYVDLYGAGTSAQVISIDDVSATVSDCTYYGFAINGTRQFQNTIGGNFGDYVQNFNDMAYLNKFISYFTEPIWFNGLYFDLTTIIPKSTFSSNEEGVLFYRVLEYTSGGGFIQRQDIELDDKNDGVYRLPISDLTLDAGTDSFSVQMYQLPSNRLGDGNDGTFEELAATWNITAGSIFGIASDAIHRSGNFSLRASGGGPTALGTTTIWTTNTPIDVTPNSDYIIEGWIYFNLVTPSFNNIPFWIRPVPTNLTVISNSPVTYNASLVGTWQYVKQTFNTGANSTVQLQAVYTQGSTIISGQIYYDDITLKGPIENLSEVKTIKVDNTCTRQNIYLTWLNNLGAWEYYNFKAFKDYGIEMGESRTIERDIFNNWDDTFINGETQIDNIGIEAAETIIVRSQFMTRDELAAVKAIRYAIRVQHVRSDNTKITVIVDKSTFKTCSDGDKLYQIEFQIKYPRIQIQMQ